MKNKIFIPAFNIEKEQNVYMNEVIEKVNEKESQQEKNNVRKGEREY